MLYALGKVASKQDPMKKRVFDHSGARQKGAVIGTIVLVSAFPTAASANPGAEAALCFAQIEFLKDRGRVTAREAAVFEAQCQCIEQRVANGTQVDCTTVSEAPAFVPAGK